MDVRPHLEISPHLISSVISAVEHTFGTVFGARLLRPASQTFVPPQLTWTQYMAQRNKNPHILEDNRGLIGFIDFVQELKGADSGTNGTTALEGFLAIGFSRDTLFPWMEKIYGRRFHRVDSQVIGGVAEVANMVHGIVKSKYNDSGFDFAMRLPRVLSIADYSEIKALQEETGVESHSTVHRAKLIFPYELGDVIVEFGVLETKGHSEINKEAA